MFLVHLDWTALLTNTGIFTLIALTYTAFVNRNSNKKLEEYKTELLKATDTFRNTLNVELEKLKLNLNKELETVKAQLNINSNRKIKLYEKQLDIITHTYEKLVIVDSAMTRLTARGHIIYQDAEKEKKERIDYATEALKDFNNYVLLQSFFLDDNVAQMLEQIRSSYRDAAYDYFELERLSGWEGKEEVTKAYETSRNATDKVTKEIPTIVESLKAEFRKIIGVIESE